MRSTERLYLVVDVSDHVDVHNLGRADYALDVYSPGSARDAPPKFGPHLAYVAHLPGWLKRLVAHCGREDRG